VVTDVSLLDADEVPTGNGDRRFVRVLRNVSPATGLPIVDNQRYLPEDNAFLGVNSIDRYKIFQVK
jgi:hypothetical protein